ncbi:MAG: DotU family type IV/VI secretion system protein [Pseudomonadota bacterium]|nr:DotU family type IV/VI secretion system protein [Pseudomonadota bacterium]
MTDLNKRQLSGGDDLASSQFRAFAAFLLQERMAAAGLAEADGRAGAATLSHALCQLIDIQSVEAGRLREGVDTQLPGRFMKAALADELMLNLDWAGRPHWRHVLVEATLMHSARAGEQVFADIDQLLHERDPARRSLARLYMHLLALGFQGRYRGGADLAPIADYRRKLFQFAWQRAPDAGGGNAVFSSQPYEHTLAGDSGQRLNKPSRTMAVLAMVVVLLLGVSEGLWLWQSAPLQQEIDRALADTQAGTPKRGTP